MITQNEAVSPAYKKYQEKMQKAIDHLKAEFTTIRAGRANPSVLDKVVVDYWGAPTKIREMANISIEPKMLTLSPYDVSAIKAINKAIIDSGIGLNPSDDGKVIRLVFPDLTEDRRKELLKQVKRIVEDSKVVLRNERRDIVEAIRKAKKDNLATEDDVAAYEKEVQKELDKYIGIVDSLLQDKEKELMQV